MKNDILREWINYLQDAMPNTTDNNKEYLQGPVSALSVVIPCKNEEKAVRLTVEGVDKALSTLNIDYEIIVVDDGSTDNTQEEAVSAGARVLVHNINMGYGNSIMDGIKISKYPVVGIIDADGTYPAELFPTLIQEAAYHDMVIGCRIWTNDNTSLLGKFLRALLYYIILYFSNVTAPDYNSGFRVFHKLNILDYRYIMCPTFSFTTSLTLLYLMMLKSVFFVPIEYSKRIGTSKVSYIRDAFRTFSYVFIITSLFQPYRLSILVILASIILNALIILWSFFAALQPAVQIGLQFTLTLVFVIGVTAMNTYPASRMYLDKLRKKSKNEI